MGLEQEIDELRKRVEFLECEIKSLFSYKVKKYLQEKKKKISRKIRKTKLEWNYFKMNKVAPFWDRVKSFRIRINKSKTKTILSWVVYFLAIVSTTFLVGTFAPFLFFIPLIITLSVPIYYGIKIIIQEDMRRR